ncbi:MAG: isoprenyl transferase [Saprospiraceae bacterium]|nr:isoprenyl transferase [Saprospiraceae bacterium]
MGKSVLIDQIDPHKLPAHVAIIMDGNGRWAQRQNKPRIFGHRNGVKAVREVTEAAAELGIKFLTLYAFSTENWNRPRIEVNALMTLLVKTIHSEVATMMDNDIRLMAIGDQEKLPDKTRKALLEGIRITSENQRMTLTLALNYSGRWEILESCRKLAKKIAKGELDPDQLDDSLFGDHLATHYMPDPELLIRTSGEYRISNFLLWQLAYSELYFTDVFWPEFRKENLYEALIDFQQRERRFGKISDQLV